MRCMTALDQRTEPAEVMATTASCMESSMTASSSRPLSSSAKSLPSRTAVSIERGLHRGELVDSGKRAGFGGDGIDARGQIAVGDAAGEGDDAAEASGDAAGNERGQGNCHGQRDKAGPESFARQARAASSRSSAPQNRERQARIDQRVEHEEDDKKPEQPDEDFGGHRKQLLASSF